MTMNIKLNAKKDQIWFWKNLMPSIGEYIFSKCNKLSIISNNLKFNNIVNIYESSNNKFFFMHILDGL